MTTWIINCADVDDDELGHARLVAGVTTKEWIRACGDDDRPADATTFMWVVLTPETGQLLQIGFRAHTEVTEDECLAQVPRLLRVVRHHLDAERARSGDLDVSALRGKTLAD